MLSPSGAMAPGSAPSCPTPINTFLKVDQLLMSLCLAQLLGGYVIGSLTVRMVSPFFFAPAMTSGAGVLWALWLDGDYSSMIVLKLVIVSADIPQPVIAKS